ncbi:hypothetical protein [Alteromonas antoniana]|uniref:hypothetical protein n=1 Tax=Alteromonas antoniana TaxID=2803813 RepID=UPI001C491F3F|nr:hypothetical protein [Alteromonas antoniana]
MESKIGVRMENCHHRLIKIREQIIASNGKDANSLEMLAIADQLIKVSSVMLDEMSRKVKWSHKDRFGFNRFIQNVESFVQLNIELLLPSHI